MNSHEQQQQHHQFQQNTQMGSGLTRYRSAPSSYLTSLLTAPTADAGFGEDDFADLFNPRALSPETQVIFSRFMNSSGAAAQENRPSFAPRKTENEEFQPPQKLQRQQSNDYSAATQPQMIYPNPSPNSEAVAASVADTSYSKVFAPFSSSCAAQIKIERGGGLIRHSSSPAGLFANINIENELKAMGSYGGGNSGNAEATFSSANRFVTDYPSSSGMNMNMMNPIPEMGSKGSGENAGVDDDVDFVTGLPWDDDAPIISDPYLNDQKNEAGNRPRTLLSHHLSLPKEAMEKLLQDSVPCKIRAKRGCATHPRSIAERVRRTKISERMRKLQELVPNMEKQTNTSDMLDLAVDYIKDLQKQVKTLSGNQAKCSCSAKQ